MMLLSSDWLSACFGVILHPVVNVWILNLKSSTHDYKQREVVEVRVKAPRFVGFLLYMSGSTRLLLMAKRRAEDALLHDSPSKRCYRSVCSVDMQLGSVAPTGGVSPPSLLALLGSRSRKRPYYFEDPEEQEETALYRKTAHCDSRMLAANVLTVQTSGSFQDRRISGTLTSFKKRAREDGTCSDNVTAKAKDTVS